GDVLVAKLARQLLGRGQRVERVAVELRVRHVGTLRGGVARDELAGPRQHALRLNARGGEQRRGNAVLLLQQSRQQVAGADVGVARGGRGLQRRLQGLVRLGGRGERHGPCPFVGSSIYASVALNSTSESSAIIAIHTMQRPQG